MRRRQQESRRWWVVLASSGVHHGKLQFTGRDDLAVDEAAAVRLADVAAHLDDLGFDEERVAGEDRAPKLHVVGRHEVADLALIVREAHDENGGRLSHRLELQDSGHDRMVWEVALEEWLVDRDIFDGGAFEFTGKVDDPVDEEERIAMGEDAEDVFDFQNRFSFWKLERWDKRHHARVFLLQHGGHARVRTMSRGDCDDVAGDALSTEHEVADEIEGLVPGEFVLEAHRFLGENFLAANDDCVFERSPFDEALVEEGLDVFVEGEGAGRSDLLFVGFLIHLAGKVLGESSVWTQIRDGDPEGFGGNDGDVGALAVVKVDRLADFPGLAAHVLCFAAGLLDEFHEGFGGAITDRRFIGIHFDQGVVHPHPGQGGDDVFDGVDTH